MMRIAARLDALGLTMPPALAPPPGIMRAFAWPHRDQDRVHLAGHSAQPADGGVARPYGAAPSARTPEAAIAARATARASLGSLQRALGDLDLDQGRARLKKLGTISGDPGFAGTTQVINACSTLNIVRIRPDIGAHDRTVAGPATLPLVKPVSVAADIALAPESS